MNDAVEIIKDEVCDFCSARMPWQDCQNCLLANAMRKIANGEKPSTIGKYIGM